MMLVVVALDNRILGEIGIVFLISSINWQMFKNKVQFRSSGLRTAKFELIICQNVAIRRAMLLCFEIRYTIYNEKSM